MFDSSELIHELQDMRDGGHLSDRLMRHAVKAIASSDDRFDWVGVCGTAVAEKANQIVGDVSEVDNYLACSPDVKSEIVVLIRAGDEVFGQIDIDSHEKDAFGEDDESALQGVADKLAEQIAAERR